MASCETGKSYLNVNNKILNNQRILTFNLVSFFDHYNYCSDCSCTDEANISSNGLSVRLHIHCSLIKSK